MIEPLRSKRKILQVGTSRYVLIPAYWPHAKKEAVIVEVYENRVVITPAK